MAQVTTAITAITTSAVTVKGLVDEVSVASRQQAQGIDQVSQAIAQMEKVTQSTAATAEESAAASEELNGQADAVMDVVHELDKLVRQQRAAGTSSSMDSPEASLGQPAARGGRIARLADHKR